MEPGSPSTRWRSKPIVYVRLFQLVQVEGNSLSDSFQVSFKWELWEELKFIFKCSGSTKPVKQAKTDEEKLEDALKEFQPLSPYAMGFEGSGDSNGNGKSELNSNAQNSQNHKEPLY